MGEHASAVIAHIESLARPGVEPIAGPPEPFSLQGASHDELAGIFTAQIRLQSRFGKSVWWTEDREEGVRWIAELLRLGGYSPLVDLPEHLRGLLAGCVHLELSRGGRLLSVAPGLDPHLAGFMIAAIDGSRFLAFPVLEGLLKHVTRTIDPEGRLIGPALSRANGKEWISKNGQVSDFKATWAIFERDCDDSGLVDDMRRCIEDLPLGESHNPVAEVGSWRNATAHGSDQPGFLGHFITLLALRVALSRIRDSYDECKAGALQRGRLVSSDPMAEVLTTIFWPRPPRSSPS